MKHLLKNTRKPFKTSNEQLNNWVVSQFKLINYRHRILKIGFRILKIGFFGIFILYKVLRVKEGEQVIFCHWS